MSLVAERQRRATAGKRMTELVGEDLIKDQAFWSHETWNEHDNTGNGEHDEDGNASFHESDEDSALRRDEFDSDFDDSESDNDEAMHEQEGAEQEAQLLRDERREKQQQQQSKQLRHPFPRKPIPRGRTAKATGAAAAAASYVDLAKRGRQALLKKKKPGKKIITGEGMNAGIVLNLPPPPAAAALAPGAAAAALAPGAIAEGSAVGLLSTAAIPPPAAPLPPSVPLAAATAAAVASSNSVTATTTTPATTTTTTITSTIDISATSPSKSSRNHSSSSSSSPSKSKVAALAATRPRRTATKLSKYTSRYRAARVDAGGGTPAAISSTTAASSTRSSTAASQTQQPFLQQQQPQQNRRLYQQEELLLEAAHETEPANTRWLLARKRYQDQYDSHHPKHHFSAGSGTTSASGKVIEKYTSRRGYLNVITFPEMDHVPVILLQSSRQQKAAAAAATGVNRDRTGLALSSSSSRRRGTDRDASVSSLSSSSLSHTSTAKCVITGKPARYRDPKTGLPYYDAAAFRELRRRHDQGEPMGDSRQDKSNHTKKDIVYDGPAQSVKPSASAVVSSTTAPSRAACLPSSAVTSMLSNPNGRPATAGPKPPATTAMSIQSDLSSEKSPEVITSNATEAITAPAASLVGTVPKGCDDLSSKQSPCSQVPAHCDQDSGLVVATGDGKDPTDSKIQLAANMMNGAHDTTTHTAQVATSTNGAAKTLGTRTSNEPSTVGDMSLPNTGSAAAAGLSSDPPNKRQKTVKTEEAVMTSPQSNKAMFSLPSPTSSPSSARRSPRRRKPSARVVESMEVTGGLILPCLFPSNGEGATEPCTTTLAPAPTSFMGKSNKNDDAPGTLSTSSTTKE